MREKNVETCRVMVRGTSSSELMLSYLTKKGIPVKVVVKGDGSDIPPKIDEDLH
jgi:hypothetical protein